MPFAKELPKIQYNFATTGILNSPLSNFMHTKRTEETERPVYVLEKNLHIWDRRWKAFYLIMFFTVNPGWDCCYQIGYHRADVEKVILLQNPETGEFEWVFFGAHSNAEGMWVPYKKCEFGANGELKIYITPTSNAMYPSQKCYRRILGFANDDCSNSEKPWTPQPSDFEDANSQSWSNFTEVVSGINSPVNMRPPPTQSITPIQRMLIFLPKIRDELSSVPTGSFV
jgi:hypothetical protein